MVAVAGAVVVAEVGVDDVLDEVPVAAAAVVAVGTGGGAFVAATSVLDAWPHALSNAAAIRANRRLTSANAGLWTTAGQRFTSDPALRIPSGAAIRAERHDGHSGGVPGRLGVHLMLHPRSTPTESLVEPQDALRTRFTENHCQVSNATEGTNPQVRGPFRTSSLVTQRA